VSTNIFLSLFLGLGVFYVILGIFVSTKIKTVKDYFLASRNVGLGALTFTLVATQIGGGMLLGSADAAYADGYLGVFYSLGMSVGFLLLGFGFASKLRAFNVVTSAQLFEKKYGSTMLRKIASLISAASMIGIFAGQVVATRALFNVLGVGNEGFLLLFWAFVIIYTVMGGLKAVVATDIFQVIFLVLIVSGIFFYSIFGEVGSYLTLGAIVKNQQSFTGFGSAFFKQLPILITSAIYPIFGQDLAQRFFAARTKKIAVVSALLAGAVIVIFSFVPVYFGMKAKLLGIALPAKTSAFYAMVKLLTNDFVFALVGCALVAAITSTADSLLCAVSSNLTQDFDFGFKSMRSKLFFSKAVTCVAGLFGISIAYYSTDILGVLAQSYGILISGLFVPILFCFFQKKLKKNGALFAMLGGSLAFVLFKVAAWQGIYSISEIGLVMVPIIISAVGYFVGSVLER
jgi:SSS family solute:Na+ symporter